MLINIDGGTGVLVMPIVEAPESIREYISWLNTIADKWRRIWEEKKVYEVSPNNKPKFYVTAAFPYPNGMMHLGHARTYTLTDIYARFKRLEGYNVLFPMGFHYTGTPILALADKIKEGDQSTILFFKKVYGLDDEVIEKMKDPMFMVRFFHKEIKEAMKIMGYSIDWRREFTSIDPDFSRFIHWQFKKLHEKGYIVQGTHPVGWDPVVGTPVSSHDTKGDVEPEIGEFTLLFFTLDDGTIMPAATLRPETVFGAVNIWVNPRAKYVKALVNGVKWIISREAAIKLSHQLKKVDVIEEFDGEKLLGLRARNPATGWKVPVLPARFVDPDVGTGIVMSVPAHAPYDYVALKEILREEKILEKLGVKPEELKPVPVVEVPGLSKTLAVDEVEKRNIESQDQRELLDELTKEVYSVEFKNGIVLKEIAERVATDIKDHNTRQRLREEVLSLIAGKPVPEAREATTTWLVGRGLADRMYEIMNGPVYSRWDNKVIVRVLENQWFIDYGREDWKKLVREAIKSIKIIPSEVKKDFEETIEWVKRRACARTRGLGTKLPWDPAWVIESLSDSTIYMAFYTINYILRRNNIKPEQLSDEVWDYILLGKGDLDKIAKASGIPSEVLEEARKEFDYWYPLDSRHSAKDLVKNHLTFFIFNHVALFPRTKWPRQIVVYGYVLYRGQKMSKSLYNVIPVKKLARELSPDGLRLAIALTSEIDQDLDFREELVYTVAGQMKRIHSLVDEYKDIIREYRSRELRKPSRIEDSWILSIVYKRLEEARRYLNESRIRAAGNIIFYIIEEDVKKYIDLLKALNRYLDDEAKIIIAKIFDAWIRVMSPYTPYYAEELWHMIGGEGLVVETTWPTFPRELFDPASIIAIEYVERLVSDIKEIIKVKKMEPEKVIVHVASPDEYWLLRKAIEYIEKSKLMREYVREVVSLMTDKKKAGQLARQVFELASNLSPDLRILLKDVVVDEKKVIEELRPWIEREVGAPIEVYYGVDEKAPYVGRRKNAIPLKPAIYIVFKKTKPSIQ